MGRQAGQKRKRRFGVLDALILLVFISGLCLLMYPWVSQFYNKTLQGRAVATYDRAIARLSPQDFSDAWDKVDVYNQNLAKTGGVAAGQAKGLPGYDDLLNIVGTGMMGHIEVDKLGIDLPIYHGVSADVLSSGIGHIEGSSLPGGGPSTHTVLSGHRGLPQSILFTDLDRLQEGDVFLLHILDRTLAYRVDQIRIVLPDQLDDLQIVEGQDYCTLVTCTPYAINTHRLLVRGTRIDYPDRAYVSADAVRIDPVLVACILATPVFLIGLIVGFIYLRRRQKLKRQLLDMTQEEQIS